MKEFETSQIDASVLLCEVNNPTQFGIAEVKENKIVKIVEKPKDPPSNLAVTGIYLLSPKIFDIFKRLKPSWRDELEITDALDMLLNENNKITFYMVTDYWKDTGTPADILHANQLLLEDLTSYNHGEIEEDVNISGNVMIGKNSIIKSGVIIKGPIIIGENCIIEGNAELGPNISIGNNSKLSGCKIKNSIIMDEAEIRCNQKIHNSIIATNSRILSSDEEKTLLLGEGTKITL